MQTIELVVTGEQKMHCSGCETRIAYTLRQLPGVRDVRANAKTQQVLVLFESADQIGAQRIGEKLEQLGYQAQRIEGAA